MNFIQKNKSRNYKLVRTKVEKGMIIFFFNWLGNENLSRL